MYRNILFAMVLIFILGMALTACGSKSTTQALSGTATVAPSTTQAPSGTATVAPSTTQAPSGTATVAPTTGGGAADGEILMKERCTKCHKLDRIISAKHTEAQWTKTVSRMVQNGAKLTSDEQKVLVAYLAKTYGP